MVVSKKLAAIAIVATLSVGIVSHFPAYAVDSELNATTLSNDSVNTTTAVAIDAEASSAPAESNKATPNATPSTTPENGALQDEQKNQENQTESQTDIAAKESSKDENASTVLNADGSSAIATQSQDAEKNDKMRLLKPVSYIFAVVMGVILFCLGRVLLFVVCSKR